MTRAQRAAPGGGPRTLVGKLGALVQTRSNGPR